VLEDGPFPRAHLPWREAVRPTRVGTDDDAGAQGLRAARFAGLVLVDGHSVRGGRYRQGGMGRSKNKAPLSPRSGCQAFRSPQRAVAARWASGVKAKNK